MEEQGECKESTLAIPGSNVSFKGRTFFTLMKFQFTEMPLVYKMRYKLNKQCIVEQNRGLKALIQKKKK